MKTGSLGQPYVVSWGGYPHPDLCGWFVYVSRSKDRLGECVKEVYARARRARVSLTPGRWYVRVVAKLRGCLEEPWQNASVHEVRISPRGFRATAAVSNVALGVVSSGGRHEISFDPSDDRAISRVQVVEAPLGYPQFGRLVAEAPVHIGDAYNSRGRASVSFPLEGALPDPGTAAVSNPTRALHIVTTGDRGKWHSESGDSVALVPFPDRAPKKVIVLAELNRAGPVVTGFNTSFSTSDGLEYDSQLGIHTRKIPTAGSADWAASGMGTAGAPKSTIHPCEKYERAIYVTTEELDLGAKFLFALDCWSEAHRRGTGVDGQIPGAVDDTLATRSVASLWHVPACPSSRDRHDGETELREDRARQWGLEWLAQTVRANGSPNSALRSLHWEVRVADTSLDLASATWSTHAPDAMYQGRFVQARLWIDDEMGGNYPIATGDLRVSALIPKRVIAGTGTVPASSTAPGTSVSLPSADPSVGGSPFPLSLNIVATPRNVSFAANLVVTHGGPGSTTFSVMAWDSTGLASSLPVPFDWYAVGW